MSDANNENKTSHSNPITDALAQPILGTHADNIIVALLPNETGVNQPNQGGARLFAAIQAEDDQAIKNIVFENPEFAYREITKISKTNSKSVKLILNTLFDIGNQYYDLYSDTQNPKEAFRWIKLAAELGHSNAQRRLGVWYESGMPEADIVQDAKEAVLWYRLSALQGNEYGLSSLGDCYKEGIGVGKDLKKANQCYQLVKTVGIGKEEIKLLIEKADLDKRDYFDTPLGRAAISSRQIGAINNLFKESTPHKKTLKTKAKKKKRHNSRLNDSKQKSIPTESKSAIQQTNAETPYVLGRRYEKGQGVAQDFKEAVRLYKLAADQGDAQAQYKLGVCYVRGQGIPQDYTAAFEWIKKAAEQKYTRAQCDLGFCYFKGQGVAENYEEAIKWYKLAADQGDAQAQYNLGVYYYLEGIKIQQNYTAAAYMWIKKAAGQGHEQAREAIKSYKLAFQYRNIEAKKALSNSKGIETAKDKKKEELFVNQEVKKTQNEASPPEPVIVILPDQSFSVQESRLASTEEGASDKPNKTNISQSNNTGYKQVWRILKKAKNQEEIKVTEVAEREKEVKLQQETAQPMAANPQTIPQCLPENKLLDDKGKNKSVKVLPKTAPYKPIWRAIQSSQGEDKGQYTPKKINSKNITEAMSGPLQNSKSSISSIKSTTDIEVEKDAKEAARLYRLAADRGDATAQYKLGVCYQGGIGVEKDFQEAICFYSLAADQGDARAQNNLSFFYENGFGVEKDIQKAVELYRASAEQGHAPAQCNLAICYESGFGVAQDLKEAVRLYKLAANQGDAQAQYNLGVCYQDGIGGVEKDLKEAVRLYRLAADQGHAAAQNNLRSLFHNRDYEATKNLNKASYWIKKVQVRDAHGCSDAQEIQHSTSASPDDSTQPYTPALTKND